MGLDWLPVGGSIVDALLKLEGSAEGLGGSAFEDAAGGGFGSEGDVGWRGGSTVEEGGPINSCVVAGFNGFGVVGFDRREGRGVFFLLLNIEL